MTRGDSLQSKVTCPHISPQDFNRQVKLMANLAVKKKKKKRKEDSV